DMIAISHDFASKSSGYIFQTDNEDNLEAMRILENLKTHYNNEKFADTKIIVDEDKNEVIYVHSQILKIQSKYLESALSQSWERKKDNYYIIKKPNATKESMDNVLKFLYFDKPFSSLRAEEFIKTFLLTDEICIDVYLNMLNQYFINNIEKLISDDLKLIFDFIESFKELQKIVVRTIFHKPKLFFSAENFQTITIQYLKLFISNDNLDIKETEILKKVIIWLNGRDLKDLNEYYNILLKYIRFDQITDNGFKILYVNLKEESINSDILKKWIDRQDTTNYKHNFKLLLKENVIKAEQLHSSCNNKDATIVIGKLKNEDSFIGGYNSLNWSTETYKGTEDSFIFTKLLSFLQSKALLSSIYGAVYVKRQKMIDYILDINRLNNLLKNNEINFLSNLFPPANVELDEEVNEYLDNIFSIFKSKETLNAENIFEEVEQEWKLTGDVEKKAKIFYDAIHSTLNDDSLKEQRKQKLVLLKETPSDI
ncbi:24711_t:CDS:2, partial [Dentiscutata erythropus]